MRNKRLWKTLMLATACTFTLGTASVPVLAAEVNTEAGVSVEAEAETEATEPEAEAGTNAVPTPAPQADTEDEIKEGEVSGSILGYTVDKATDGVITLTDDDLGASSSFYTNLTVNVSIENAQNSSGIFYLNTDNSGDHALLLGGNDLSKFNFTLEVPNVKEQLVAAGGTKTFSGTFTFGTEREGVLTDFDTMTYSVTLKYVGGDTGNGGDNGNNGGGTETPDPEQPEKPVDPENPDNGNGDNGNTEIPDPEQPENPDSGDNGDNGNNGGDTENPDNGEDTQKPDDDGNEQKPDGDNTQKPEEQKPITGQTVKPATTNSNTSPKTADMTAVLPVLGTGITSIGVAVAAIFKKRK